MSTQKIEIANLHNSELYLYFYGASLGEERTVRECNYIEKYCSIKGEERILDLACGHGRHSILFAERNHRVSGIDISKSFLQIAKTRSKEKQLEIEFIEGDILGVEYKAEFDIVLLLFNTLGFFDRQDAAKIFEKISQSLIKGGKAFIDCKNRDHIIKEIKPYEVYEKGEDLMIDRLSFNPKHGTTTNKRIYLKDGKRYDAPFTMYSYNYTDLEYFAERADLKIIKILGGWKEEAFDSESRRIILIVEKVK